MSIQPIRWLLVGALGVASPAVAETPFARIVGLKAGKLSRQVEAAIGLAQSPATTRVEARRRARLAADHALAVFRSEGYYEATAQPVVSEDDHPAPIVKVELGRRFRIDNPQLAWIGFPPETSAQQAGEQVMGLTLGTPGRAWGIVSAEGRIVAALAKRGYADVHPDARQVIVDHAKATVQPTLRMVAGERVKLGRLIWDGHGRTRRASLEALASWRRGTIYDPAWIGRLETQLRDTGVYDQVLVSLAPPEQHDPDGARPITVSLVDRRPRAVDLGLGWSSSEGASFDGRWSKYNATGRFETWTVTGKASQIGQTVGAEISRPHWRRPGQTLKIAADLHADQTDAFDETGTGLQADVVRKTQDNSVLTLGSRLTLTRWVDKTSAAGITFKGSAKTRLAASLLGALALDRSNDVLNPVRGWRLETRGEPTIVLGTRAVPYVKLQVQSSAYLPMDPSAALVLAGRAKIGTLVGGAFDDIVASQRFYAGGGGSVRGYSYQAIGPRLSDNSPEGGRSVFEASAEVRRKVTHALSGVIFVDAGAISSQRLPQTADLRLGAGVGLRYDLGFGPLRFDIAAPLNRRTGDPAFQIYLSIGQSF